MLFFKQDAVEWKFFKSLETTLILRSSNMIKNIIFTIAVLLTLTACNTVAGIGQDVKAAGQGVSNAAHSVQNAM